MADKKQSLVEEALLQMENLKEAVTENAKGILASTMKEEISQLVKESLKEEEVEMEESAEVETEMEEAVTDEMTEQEDDTEDLVDVDDVEVDDLELDLDNDSDDEEETELDLDIEDSDELDLDDLMLSDLPGDDLEVDSEEEILAPLDLTMATDDEVLAVFKKMGEEDGILVQQTEDGVHIKDDTEDVEYEIKMESKNTDSTEGDIIYEIEIGEEDDLEEGWNEMVDEEETDEASCGTHEEVSEMKVDFGEEMKVDFGEDMDEVYEEDMEEMIEGYGSKHEVEEGEEHEMVEGETEEGEMEEGETEEGVSRSFNQGRNQRVRPDNYPDKFKRPGARNESLERRKLSNEVKQLREKNEEYRNALNVFREKLTEVAVFNSNLAYATRLFTEHTTTKQEKINILRRFDGVETLKESKSLYKTIKDSLNDTGSETIKESFETTVEKTPSNGSATNLIENKTYENPQFMRMKDLMKKLK